MKDRSKFISSVIVSLFAGFIYYFIGPDINENVSKSIKAVFSSNESEQYFSSECFSLITDKSNTKSARSKNKNYKKGNPVRKDNSYPYLPGEEIFSGIENTSQAMRPSPDRNVDFTAELEKLTKSNKQVRELKPGREFKIERRNSNENQVADNNSKTGNFQNLKVKYYEDNYRGNGFEYNFIFTSGKPEAVKTNIETKNTVTSKVEIIYDYKNYYEKVIPEKYLNKIGCNEVKTHTVAPKIVSGCPEAKETEEPEANADDDSCGDTAQDE